MFRALVCAVVILIFASAAHGQSFRSVEVSGAYAFLHDPRDDTNLPAGWVAGVEVPLVGWLSAAGEVGGNHKTVAGFGSDFRLNVFAAMAGPRASVRLARLTEFVQVLAGVVHATGEAFDVRTTNTAFAVQAGIGLDYPLATRLAARVQFDARFVRGRPDGAAPGDQFRALTGLAYIFR